MNDVPMICIVGGAVAGSEAAALCAERGAKVVVIEQGDRPYGKIEDGLPRWHDKLRRKECARIDENLRHPGIHFVPRTRLGGDITFGALRDLGFSATMLATGAWRDRPLPVPGVDAFLGKGLLYQNAFVHWFNHATEPAYAGPQYDCPEGALVVGGGLASIDVVKILSLETHATALRRQGHEVDVGALEHRGVVAWCRARKHDAEGLGVVPPTLYYRRTMEAMPLAPVAADADAHHRAKVEAARVKIMKRVMERYRVRFVPLRVPVAGVVENERLAGLVFRATEIVGGRVREIPDSEETIRAPLVVSSIGSVPVPIEGIPMRGELYDYEDWETGALRGCDGVYGLGNVLTGKGNIKESRQNALAIAEGWLDRWRNPHALRDAVHAEARAMAEPTVDAALTRPPPGALARSRIERWVEERQRAVGYHDYASWIAKSGTEPAHPGG